MGVAWNSCSKCGESFLDCRDYSEIVYCDDLLQAYWKLACEIAKGSVVYE